MFLDELATRFNFVAHEDTEHFVGFGRVGHLDLNQGSILWIQRCLAEFFRVHLAQSFKASHLHPFFTSGSNRRDERPQVFESRFIVASRYRVTSLLNSGSFLWQKRIDGKAELED